MLATMAHFYQTWPGPVPPTYSNAIHSLKAFVSGPSSPHFYGPLCLILSQFTSSWISLFSDSPRERLLRDHPRTNFYRHMSHSGFSPLAHISPPHTHKPSIPKIPVTNIPRDFQGSSSQPCKLNYIP